MPLIIRDLPTVTFSSGATASPAVGLEDDTSNLGVILTTVTSSGTFTVQVEPTDTGTNFGALVENASAIVVVGSQFVSIGGVSFRQIRLTATAAVNDGRSISLTKQITV